MEFLPLAKETSFLPLTKSFPSLKKLKMIVDWDEHPIHKGSLTLGFDLDIFIYALHADGKIKTPADVCYYLNKNILNGTVQVPVDNRTGAGEEDEFGLLDLENIPKDRKFALFVFVYEAAKRGYNFGMMSNAKVRLEDMDTNTVIQGYNITQFPNGTALHVGNVAHTADGWQFEPIGEAAEADANQVAQAYL